MFFTGLAFSSTLTGVSSLSCISTNQNCKVRPQIVNINRDEPVFFLLVLKQANAVVVLTILMIHMQNCLFLMLLKAFCLISRINETRHIEWHETCKRKCRLNASVCNNKQCWNKDKFRCESKESIDEGACDKGSIWNPSNCECECDKSCHIGEY